MITYVEKEDLEAVEKRIADDADASKKSFGLALDGEAQRRADADQALRESIAAVREHVDEVDADEIEARAKADAALDERVTRLEARPTTGSGYVGLPCTVISAPTEKAIQAGVDAWAANRSGAFAKTKLVFAFTGQAKMANPIVIPASAGQIQNWKWEGSGKRATQITYSRSDVPLLTCTGQIRNFEFKDLTFFGENNAKLLYFYSSQSKANQDGAFRRVEFNGACEYGLMLDGPDDFNLNSEMIFEQVACSNSSSFTSGLFVSGRLGGPNQQDQAQNYGFDHCKFEGSHGPYIVLNKGGNVTIQGGAASWLHTGDSNGGVPAGEMIYIPKGPHNDATMQLRVFGLRAELRGPQSKLYDIGWGPDGRVTMIGVDTSANAFKVDGPEGTLRGGARLTTINGFHGGYVELVEGGGTLINDGGVFRGAAKGGGAQWARTPNGPVPGRVEFR